MVEGMTGTMLLNIESRVMTASVGRAVETSRDEGPLDYVCVEQGKHTGSDERLFKIFPIVSVLLKTLA